MQRAIELANRADNSINPNPRVGAVLVYNDKIISEAWHEKFGAYHAERLAIEKFINANNDSGKILKNSTLYVTLEPCNHYGKTPPCTEIIIKYKIPKVVIGQIDTNPMVFKQGIKTLEQAGVKVTFGVLEDQCKSLNKYYNTFYINKRPYIIIKWAQSADSYITAKTNTKTQITDAYTTILQHKHRASVDGLLIGYRTAKVDNPLLSTRYWPGKSPVRIVIDKNLSLPETLNIFNSDSKVIVFNNLKTFRSNNVYYIKINCDTLNISKEIIENLYDFGLQSIIIEGGTKTINLFSNTGLWDEMHIYTSPKILNGGYKAPLKPYNTVSIIKIKLLSDYLEVYKNSLYNTTIYNHI